MIDVVTRYSRAVFIKRKRKEVIVDMIIQLWMSIFGAANIFLMDKGGEFANDEMRELGNQFAINIKHTAAYAPWANGINERNRASIDIMMEKMLENLPQLSEETALQYAVSIRTCSMYVHGFTPAQLAIGQNPRLLWPFLMACQLLKKKPQALLLLNILIQFNLQERPLLQPRLVPN